MLHVDIIRSHVNIIMLYRDINKLQVKIIMLHVKIIYLHVGDRSMPPKSNIHFIKKKTLTLRRFHFK